jgi:hypothetical protein
VENRKFRLQNDVRIIIQLFWKKRKKYTYQEWPHPEDTASTYSQKAERNREHGFIK